MIDLRSPKRDTILPAGEVTEYGAQTTECNDQAGDATEAPRSRAVTAMMGGAAAP